MYVLYVGANNDTGIVDSEKLQAILDRSFNGCTFFFARGLWEGKWEPSAVVQVSSATNSREYIEAVIREIKTELRQDCVALQTLPELEFI